MFRGCVLPFSDPPVPHLRFDGQKMTATEDRPDTVMDDLFYVDLHFRVFPPPSLQRKTSRRRVSLLIKFAPQLPSRMIIEMRRESPSVHLIGMYNFGFSPSGCEFPTSNGRQLRRRWALRGQS